MRTIAVVDHEPSWPEAFERVRSYVLAVLGDVAVGIEHVGSTAVPGLAAKPVVDIDIIVRDEADVASAIGRLATLAYVHRGNLGIEGREAFDNPQTGLPEHNLYVCPAGSVALANHLAVRDYLRAHPAAAQRYGELKKQLASTFPHEIDSYIKGKTAFILAILRGAGFSDVQLAAIGRANNERVEAINPFPPSVPEDPVCCTADANTTRAAASLHAWPGRVMRDVVVGNAAWSGPASSLRLKLSRPRQVDARGSAS